MADPVIVPPTPTITQTDSPEQIASTLSSVQAAFDRVLPEKGVKKTPVAPNAPVAPTPPPVATTPPAPQETKPVQPVESKPAPEDGPKLPSFIEEALKIDPVKKEAPPPTDVPDIEQEWPEDLPVEQKQSRIQGLRDAYKKLKEEVKTLQTRPPAGADEATRQRLEFLETKNKELETVVSRTNVEQHREFQERILKPMTGAWNEAARIVHEAGGNPQDLAKALALGGRAQYEAIDAVLEGMPESAKIEANEALRQYKNLDMQRRQALADAPKTAQALQKADLQRQYEAISRQKEEMKGMFDSVVQELRDNARIEVLRKSNDPDAAWWNEQADYIENTARSVFLENTDMKKVAYACALAPMADVYRKLWMLSEKRASKLDGIIKQKFGSEPSMSESGGNVRNGVSDPQEDLKKPFTDVFLKKFHEERARGVR